ncbi:MAG: PsbP-related protein [Candidatus Margulisiibacteriota bacterium]|jgi:hypothetical protein
MDKRLILFFLVGLVILIMVVGCAPPKKKEVEQFSAAAVETIQASTQEMKTYVSKYGFSVSYPADWYLEEEKDIKPSEEELKGYRNFQINHGDVKESVSLDFTVFKDASLYLGSPKGGEVARQGLPAKLVYFAKKLNSLNEETFAGLRKISVRGGEIYIYKHKDERYSETRALFYLKKTDGFCDVSLGVYKNRNPINDVRAYREIFLSFIKGIEIYP